jgi:hypothetical protein
MGDSQVKISKPAVLIAAALATAAVTACSSSPHMTAAKLHPRVSGVTAGPGIAAAFSKDPVCQRFQRDLKVWKSAVTEPGDASTVLLNTSTRDAWVKFGHQLGQLSHAAKGSNATRKAARTRRDLARTASQFPSVLRSGRASATRREQAGPRTCNQVVQVERLIRCERQAMLSDLPGVSRPVCAVGPVDLRHERELMGALGGT